MTYRVVFSPEAEEQLIDLYRYIAKAASPSVAARYIEAIVSHCESLNIFPLRGTPRGDVRPDLRITTYKKQAVDRKACEPDYTSHHPPRVRRANGPSWVWAKPTFFQIFLMRNARRTGMMPSSATLEAFR